jgi:hypothetical protein
VRYKINTVRYDGFKKYKNIVLFDGNGGFTVLIYWIITKGKLGKKEPDSFRNGKWFME